MGCGSSKDTKSWKKGPEIGQNKQPPMNSTIDELARRKGELKKEAEEMLQANHLTKDVVNMQLGKLKANQNSYQEKLKYLGTKRAEVKGKLDEEMAKVKAHNLSKPTPLAMLLFDQQKGLDKDYNFTKVVLEAESYKEWLLLDYACLRAVNMSDNSLLQEFKQLVKEYEIRIAADDTFQDVKTFVDSAKENRMDQTVKLQGLDDANKQNELMNNYGVKN